MLTKEEQDIFYKKLGELIRQARKNDGNKKQEVLANELGFTRTWLSNIEKGNQRIQLHMLFDLARILKVDINELLPKMDVSPNISSSNKQLETVISNKIHREVDDYDSTMKKLEDWIKKNQKRK